MLPSFYSLLITFCDRLDIQNGDFRCTIAALFGTSIRTTIDSQDSARKPNMVTRTWLEGHS
jgi:hypothetical protein